MRVFRKEGLMRVFRKEGLMLVAPTAWLLGQSALMTAQLMQVFRMDFWGGLMAVAATARLLVGPNTPQTPVQDPVWLRTSAPHCWRHWT